jgi:hypothetical protein
MMAEEKRYRASLDLLNLAQNWDGPTHKIKMRLPVGGGKKIEVLIAPGQVISTTQPKVMRALERWTPPPIYINGGIWRPQEHLFTECSDDVDVNLDDVKV